MGRGCAVYGPPAITSQGHYTVQLHHGFVFRVTTTGYPVPSLSATGLPEGVHLSSDGYLTGWTRAAGVYTIEITASSSQGTTTQSFTLTVQ